MRSKKSRFPLPAEDVVVVHNGVDLQRFHPRLRATEGAQLRRSLEFASDDVVVLFLGTGYGRKGLEKLLAAFAELRRTQRNVRLMVVGYDSAIERYRVRAKQLGIDDATRFLGGRDAPQACYAAADLYVLPTLNDPFANSTLEALASDLPVITTDANGAAELMVPDRTGVVLRATDVENTLHAALQVWTNRERLDGVRGRPRALAEQHGHERATSRTIQILEGVRRGPHAA